MASMTSTFRSRKCVIGPRIRNWSASLLAVLLLLSSRFVTGQITDTQVEITPGHEMRMSTNKKPEAFFDTRIKPFKVNVDLVLVTVTVSDSMDRLVTGLDREHFHVFDNNEAQTILHFSTEDAPVSLGVILDTSGSMDSKIQLAREAILQFLKAANPQDEFFVVTFADKPQQIASFTTVVEDIASPLVYTAPKGRTALLDAVYLGLSKMREAKYSKKALLILSDGGDNNSRYTEKEIKSVVEEADTLIYAIGIYDRSFPTTEERYGPLLLDEITTLTGGRAFTVDNPNELVDVALKIGLELRNQYVLGYRPAHPVRDGRWHKLKIKLSPPKGLPHLQLNAKKGYYAPPE